MFRRRSSRPDRQQRSASLSERNTTVPVVQTHACAPRLVYETAFDVVLVSHSEVSRMTRVRKYEAITAALTSPAGYAQVMIHV